MIASLIVSLQYGHLIRLDDVAVAPQSVDFQ
jgi:hypothetical protein